MEHAATLTAVSKSFKGLNVLQDVNLAVPRGSLCGIQGPNGSGKSVLFKLICGLVTPDAGEVWLSTDLREKGDSYPIGVGAIIAALPCRSSTSWMQEEAVCRCRTCGIASR